MTEVLWPTVREASKQLGVSGAYLRKLIGQGKLWGHLRGNTWLLDPESLRQFAESRKKKTGAHENQS